LNSLKKHPPGKFTRGKSIKRVALLGSVLLSLSVVNVSAAADTSATLAQIARALSQGDSRTAERLVALALAQPSLNSSQESELLLDRAKIDELHEQFPDALADLTKAIDGHALPQPIQIGALLERGLLLVALNRLDDAIEDYNAVLALDPHSWSALNERASAYHRQNRISEAQRDYLASLAAGNKNPEYSYFGLGQIAEEQGETATARSFYIKAVAANPKYGLADERLKRLGGHIATPPSTSTPQPSSTPVAPPVVTQRPSATADQPIHLVPPDVASVRQSGGQRLRLTPADAGLLRQAKSQVQLGVWASEERAAAAWSRAVQLAGKALAPLSPSIIPVDIPGKGQLFRLRVTAITNAADLCASLKTAGLDCMPVKE
jgi:tetratricopeptide (TPR) repeat protein